MLTPPRLRRLPRNSLPFGRREFLALAFPPLTPPSFPNATAAGFLPAFGSGNGDPSIFSPIALFHYTERVHGKVVIFWFA
jgi:hypothetical protein